MKILFKYYNYRNVFDKININNLFKHKSYDHVTEPKNKIFSFDFNNNLFITNLKFFENI